MRRKLARHDGTSLANESTSKRATLENIRHRLKSALGGRRCFGEECRRVRSGRYPGVARPRCR
jgi:hypothetical protein